MEKMDFFNSGYTEKQEKLHEKAAEKFKKANLSDDILFTMIMLNDDAAKIIISIILGKKVVRIRRKSVQEVLPNFKGYKSVRLDVIVQLMDGTLCNVEMQVVNNDHMPKRSRFYQGLIDVVNLYSGKEIRYKQLPNTIIVFITEFDVFDKGLFKYTFTNKCHEVSDLELGDGCTKIFLNTLGKNRNNEPEILINFLKFVHESSKENALADSKLQKLYEIVQDFKNDKEKEADYMRADAYLAEGERIGREKGERIGKEKGREEGEQKLAELIKNLQNVGRSSEISKVLNDAKYRKQLMKEFYS